MTTTDPTAVAPCRAQYPYQGRFDRIVECHLERGHPGEHEEADTEYTWTDPQPVATVPSAAPAQPADPLNLDAITDSGTGWDPDWIADLPGNLPESTYLHPNLRRRAQHEIAALLADVDRLVAEVRRLRAEPAGFRRERAILHWAAERIGADYDDQDGDAVAELLHCWADDIDRRERLSSVPPAGTEGGL